MGCEWCLSDKVKKETTTVFWKLQDGTRAIEITDTPCISCNDCGMTYQEEGIIERFEAQLVLINTKRLENTLTFQSLMEKPRLLKRNYFKFD
jgi:uncharacterized YokU family protein